MTNIIENQVYRELDVSRKDNHLFARVQKGINPAHLYSKRLEIGDEYG